MNTKCFFSFVLGILLASSCTDVANTSYDTTICKTNIDRSQELFTHLLNDKQGLYLFGSESDNQLDYRTNEISIAYSSINDKCDWAPFTENIPGKCQAVYDVDSTIYLISRQQYSDSLDVKYSKHKLYEISKVDGRITELHEWNKGNAYVKDMYFDSSGNGYIFYRPSGNPLEYQILKTGNGGYDWEVINLNKPIITIKSTNDHFYILSYKNNNRNDWIYSIEKQNNNLDSLQFNLDITDFHIDNRGNYWFLGKKDKKTILQKYENGKTHVLNVFPENLSFSRTQLYKYNNTIVVLGSVIDHNLLSGFGGTKPMMYLSNDNGLNWKEVDLTGVLYLKPVSFYKDKHITAYIGSGKIMVFNLQEDKGN